MLFVGISWDYSGVFSGDSTTNDHICPICKCQCCWLVIYHASTWYSHYIPSQNPLYIVVDTLKIPIETVFPCNLQYIPLNTPIPTMIRSWWYFINFHQTSQFFKNAFSHLQFQDHLTTSSFDLTSPILKPSSRPPCPSSPAFPTSPSAWWPGAAWPQRRRWHWAWCGWRRCRCWGRRWGAGEPRRRGGKRKARGDVGGCRGVGAPGVGSCVWQFGGAKSQILTFWPLTAGFLSALPLPPALPKRKLWEWGLHLRTAGEKSSANVKGCLALMLSGKIPKSWGKIEINKSKAYNHTESKRSLSSLHWCVLNALDMHRICHLFEFQKHVFFRRRFIVANFRTDGAVHAHVFWAPGAKRWETEQQRQETFVWNQRAHFIWLTETWIASHFPLISTTPICPPKMNRSSTKPRFLGVFDFGGKGIVFLYWKSTSRCHAHFWQLNTQNYYNLNTMMLSTSHRQKQAWDSPLSR